MIRKQEIKCQKHWIRRTVKNIFKYEKTRHIKDKFPIVKIKNGTFHAGMDDSKNFMNSLMSADK